MQIINLTEEYTQTYCICLEDWSGEMKEAGNHKAHWYRQMKDRGLGVKLALNDDGQAVGMIQYAPIEETFADGEQLCFIYCIWVHGYKQGVGNHQKKGIGKALIAAAEEDARRQGAYGMAAWGLALPFWMKASWFKKQGYKKIDKRSIQVLLWKPFNDAAQPPRWISQQKKPGKTPGKVTVTAFKNGWCPAQNITFERAKRAAAEFGDQVQFREIDTFNRTTFLEWGLSDALYIDTKSVRTGPPPTFEKIKKKIAQRVKKL